MRGFSVYRMMQLERRDGHHLAQRVDLPLLLCVL